MYIIMAVWSPLSIFGIQHLYVTSPTKAQFSIQNVLWNNQSHKAANPPHKKPINRWCGWPWFQQDYKNIWVREQIVWKQMLHLGYQTFL